MLKLTPPPDAIRDRAVYEYLWQMQEYLALVIEGAGQTVNGEEGSVGKATGQALDKQFQALKAVIVKTANEVEKSTQIDMDGLRTLVDNVSGMIQGSGGIMETLATIQSNYVANGDFGTFQQNILQRFTVDETSIAQQIYATEQAQAAADAVSAEFSSYRIDTEGYIRGGIVDEREDHTPVIGIAIGQNLSVDGTQTVDGKTYHVIKKEGFRAVYAADQLAFWQGDQKIAYMKNNKLYIRSVETQTQIIGQWEISDGAGGLAVKWGGA